MEQRKPNITTELIAETDNYHDQYASWFTTWCLMSPDKKLALKQNYSSQFPNLLTSQVHDRILMRKVFDKHYYKRIKRPSEHYYPKNKDEN